MNLSEKDLEDIIFNANRKQLSKRGLLIEGVIKRQLNIGNYGIADLVTFSLGYNDLSYHRTNGEDIFPFLHITVYELKKDKLCIDALLQAVRYVKGINEYLKERNFYDRGFDACFSIKLIGRTINTSTSFSYLADILPNLSEEYNSDKFLEVYTYNFDAIKGIKFEIEEGYRLIEGGFNLGTIF